jgi:hypothetical protein
LVDEDAITKRVHWVLGIPWIFLNTVGDLQELAKVLRAADSYEERPPDEEMNKLVEEMKMQTLFN